MKVVPSDEEPQFRCYVVLPPIRYSSWTNISYIGRLQNYCRKNCILINECYDVVITTVNTNHQIEETVSLIAQKRWSGIHWQICLHNKRRGTIITTITIPVLCFVLVPPTETYPVCSVDSEHSPIEEGDNISLICRSRGAVPTATLTWYNRTSGELLTAGQQQPDIVATISVSKYDNGDTFQCTAKNEATRLLARTPNCSVHLNVSCEQETITCTHVVESCLTSQPSVRMLNKLKCSNRVSFCR